MNKMEYFHLRTSFVCVLLITLPFSGCYAPYSAGKKMYEGPEVSPEKRAVIRCGESEKGKIYILEVDKKWTSLSRYICPYEVYVLPGKHNLFIKTDFLGVFAVADLWLVAEAGETYIIKSELSIKRKNIYIGDPVRIWIESHRTGLLVGGITGSIDEPK